jgi:hypothetical protein
MLRHFRIVSLGLIAIFVATLSTKLLADPAAPPAAAVQFAQRTSDLMLATLFAALTQEFDETTAANVAEGSTSIGLIFNDRNDDMRLVGTLDPLSDNDLPADAFEDAALARALTGTATTSVERVRGRWYYRRSIPLSNFRSECSLCHTNFPIGPTSDWVGALMLRVPIQD